MTALIRFTSLAALAVVLTLPASAFDWGASVDETTLTLVPQTPSEGGYITQSFSLRGWAHWDLGPGSRLQVKANLTDSLKVSLAQGNTVTNTLSGDIDTLSWTTDAFVLGRSDFKDFDGSVINSRLDGAKASTRASVAGLLLDLRGFVGTSALVFKTGSTVVVSQADIADRSVTADLTKPSTLLAPPRVIAYAEAGLPRLVSDQVFRLALAGQADLRQGTAKAGDTYDKTDTKALGAGVSTAYLGLGGQGRVVGPVYWSASAWVGAGASLTPVTGSSSTSVWKDSSILGALGSADLVVLVPDWGRTVAGLGVTAGTADPDGATSDKNKASGSSPSLYTGWVGISRTAAAQIFNPQPANAVTAKAYWSVKPFAGLPGPAESLQTIVTGLTFLRPTTAAIDETGLKSAATDLYLGSEADLNLFWRPASDWGSNLAFGVFVPNGQALDRGLEIKAQLGLNLSF